MGDHLIVMHSAVRALPGYNRHEAPSILLHGSSVDRGSEHGRAVMAQLGEPHTTLTEAIRAAVIGLREAGLPQSTRGQAEAGESLELMPEEMYRVLEDVVEKVVDGEWDELVELSSGRLSAEDLRRRVEDDVPEPLTLPPRSHYGVEAVSRSEDLEDEGWAFFLDLWAEEAPARLHIEGALVLTADERYLIALSDILP
jgi:hypothetical protein